MLFEVAQRACEIRHRDHGHRIGGAARRLRDRRVDADRAVLRHDHGVRAEGIRAAQARAQVVRIGDAVENEEQRRLSRRPDHFIERDLRRCRVDDRDDALVAVGPGKVAQARFVGRVHRTAARPPHAREARACAGRACVGHVERKNGLRPLPQTRRDRVEAVQGSRGRHFRGVRTKAVQCSARYSAHRRGACRHFEGTVSPAPFRAAACSFSSALIARQLLQRSRRTRRPPPDSAASARSSARGAPTRRRCRPSCFRRCARPSAAASIEGTAARGTAFPGAASGMRLAAGGASAPPHRLDVRRHLVGTGRRPTATATRPRRATMSQRDRAWAARLLG